MTKVISNSFFVILLFFVLKSNFLFCQNGKVVQTEIEGGKIVGLDYYYNHEIKKDPYGNFVRYHYTWEDTANSGYSELRNIIRDLGAKTISIEKRPEHENLSGLSVYIIVDPDIPSENPNPNYIGSADIKNIVSWIKKGGVLMLFANDKGNCELKHLNNLSDNFGIHFNEDSRNRVTGKDFDVGKFDKFPNHPIFKNVKKIYLKEISSLKLSGNAKAILQDKGDVIMASASYGQGFVFAVGDPWFYNEYIDNRMLPIGYENFKAAENLFKWLMPKARIVNMKK
jgi:unsaturated rhamnogalacturonyl hydrolase